MRRLTVTVRGTVQGVGFRPFVYGAATSRGLSGWVENGPNAVQLEVQGTDEELQSFLLELRTPPPAARIESIDVRDVSLGESDGFDILPSREAPGKRPVLPADLAVCGQCAAEMDDPKSRRHRYAFTNCTRCGPRYSIAVALPYDRARTSMKAFAFCASCADEYAQPRDRRFHAEPIACAACGPTLSLLLSNGAGAAVGDDCIDDAVCALERGEVLALKGLGGFQLLVDATSEVAVTKLRARKQRDEKPFAVLFPSLESVIESCVLSETEAVALASSEAPIVLLRRRDHSQSPIVEGVAPRNPRLGVMLPYTPLHRVLVAKAGRPLVCTSGNLSGEPMCIDDAEALERLGGIADLFLTHNRPIVRPVDDSVVRADDGGLQVLRRARGYAPLPLRFRASGTSSILALGAQLKSTVALRIGADVVVSQHLGDLFTAESALLLERTAVDLMRFFETVPEVLACDLHPDYASTRLAETLSRFGNIPIERIQHHHAHIAACVAEHGLRGPVLGLAWDGAGLGTDGTLWGGEALVVEGASFRRVAHLRPFPLPGGESAMREPTRCAVGLLFEIYGRSAAEHIELEPSRARALFSMLEAGAGCPRTSSMGRLFDAVSALTGARGHAGYEGQAAMELERAADGTSERAAYPVPLRDGEPSVADWEPLVHALLSDRARRLPRGAMSARFHNALVDLAESIAARTDLPRVVLSGGCFQNIRLLETVRDRLSSRGFEVFTPRLYPPNDGGISLGQLFVAACRRESGNVPGHTG